MQDVPSVSSKPSVVNLSAGVIRCGAPGAPPGHPTSPPARPFTSKIKYDEIDGVRLTF
jgi:hypothetical protein